MLTVMLRAFYLAFFSGPKAEERLKQFKEADLERDGVASQVAQTVLVTAVAEMFENPAWSEFLIRQQPLQNSVTALSERLDSLLEGSSGEFVREMLAPHRQLTQRLKTDYSAEKQELAKYVVKSFFTNGPQRCFIQASTTAIELGAALTKEGSVSDGSLFHTNSIVFPMAVLRERCPHWVYTFCGSIYDPMCGGWLFPSTETETTRQLRDLFDRPRDPLTTVFLTPLTTSAEGQMYFIKNETVHLVATILATAVQHVVIMTVAPRVTGSVADGQSWLSESWLDCLSRKKKVSLVMMGQPRQNNLIQLVAQFAEKGVDVHFCPGVGGQWSRK